MSAKNIGIWFNVSSIFLSLGLVHKKEGALFDAPSLAVAGSRIELETSGL